MSELQAPFGLTPSGGIATVTSPVTLSQQHVQALVSTNPGERVMRPTYGVPLSSYLFGLDASQVATAVGNDIATALATWEPSISLQDVKTSVSDTSQGIASVEVDYSPGAASAIPASVQTATVLVGGSVVGP